MLQQGGGRDSHPPGFSLCTSSSPAGVDVGRLQLWSAVVLRGGWREGEMAGWHHGLDGRESV